jgi:hypothetical protein
MVNFSISRSINDIINLAKLFYSLKQSNARDSGLSFATNQKLVFLITFVIIPFFAIPFYSLILVLFTINPFSPDNSLKVIVGSGINIVALLIVFQFIIFLIINLYLVRQFFNNPQYAELLRTSPIDFKKLLIGLKFSDFFMLEFWTSCGFISVYVVYRLIKTIPIDLIEIILLIIFALLLTLTSALFGLVIGSSSLDNSKRTIFSRNNLLIYGIMISAVLAFIGSWYFKTTVFHFFSPVNWSALGVYSLITGNNLEYRTLLLLLIILLFASLVLLPHQLRGELPTLNIPIRKKSSIIKKLVQNISCSVFRGNSQTLAILLFQEEWERKRLLKFLLSTIFIMILFLYFRNAIYLNLETDIYQLNSLLPISISLILGLIPLIHREISYSFFNNDGRFLFFKSTPSGYNKIVKIRLYFLFIWQFILIIVSSSIIYFLNAKIDALFLILFGISAGFNVLSLDFLLQCYFPKYYGPGSADLLDQLFIFFIIGISTNIIVLSVYGLGSLFLPEVLIGLFLIIIAFLMFNLNVNLGITKLEENETLK